MRPIKKKKIIHARTERENMRPPRVHHRDERAWVSSHTSKTQSLNMQNNVEIENKNPMVLKEKKNSNLAALTSSRRDTVCFEAQSDVRMAGA